LHLKLFFDGESPYLGASLSNYYLYKVAECLDTRTFQLLSDDDKFECLNLIESQNLCTDFEKTGRCLTPTQAPTQAPQSGRRGASVTQPSQTPVLSAAEQLQLRITGVPKTVPPVRVEFALFLEIMSQESSSQCDPLDFWATYSAQFKILSRIAAQVLPVPACSADVERLFSISGKVCTPERSSMDGEMINILTSLHYWLKKNISMFLGRMRAEKQQTRGSVESQ